MNWVEVAAYALIALGLIAGGYIYWLRIRTNPLILLADAWGWAVKAWPSIKPVLIKIIWYFLASSPETQARAREDSRMRNEPGKGRGPER